MIKFFMVSIAMLLFLYIFIKIIVFCVYMGGELKSMFVMVICSISLVIIVDIFYTTGFIFYNDHSITNADRLSTLGLICSTILGFVGTYIIFLLTLNKEKKKEMKRNELELEIEKKYNLELLISFLEYTISETQSIVEAICKEFIMITCKEKNIGKENFSVELEDGQKWFEESLRKVSNTQKNRLCDFLEDDVYNSLSLLVYDDNWQMYLKHEDRIYISVIASWVKILNSKEPRIDSFIKKRDMVVEYLRLLEKKNSIYNERAQSILKLKAQAEVSKNNLMQFSWLYKLQNKIIDHMDDKELREREMKREEEIKGIEWEMKKLLSNKSVNLSNEIVMEYLYNLKTSTNI